MFYSDRRIEFSSDLDYRFDRRASLDFGDILGNGLQVAWDAEIVSIRGARYAVWLPREMMDNKDERNEFLKECKFQASVQGDRVALTYSYIPEVG